MFSLWIRPTIPFRLECESESIKQDLTSQISEIAYTMSQDGSEKIGGEEFVLNHSYMGNIGVSGVVFLALNGCFYGIFSCAGKLLPRRYRLIPADIIHTILIITHVGGCIYFLYKGN